MRKMTLQKLCSWFLILTLFLFNSGGANLVFAQNTNTAPQANSNSTANLKVVNADAIKTEIQRLNAELTKLEAQLPEKTKAETPLKEREAYVQKILGILARLEALELKLTETAQGNGSGLALILKEIRYNKDIKNVAQKDEEVTNENGFSIEPCLEGNQDCTKRVNETIAIKLEDYPRKIIMGEPISFKVKAVRRHVWKHGHNGGGFWHSYAMQPANVSVFFDPTLAMGAKPISLYFFGVGKKPLVYRKSEVTPISPNKSDKAGLTGWADEETLTLDLAMESKKKNTKGYKQAEEYFVSTAESSGHFVKAFYSEPSPYDANNRLEIPYSFFPGGSKTPLDSNKGKVGLRIEVAFHRPDQYGGNHIPETQKLILVYEWGGIDEEGLLASEFQMPDALNESLESAMGTPPSVASDDDDDSNRDSSANDDGTLTSGEDGLDSNSGSDSGSGSDSAQGERSPDNPNVQSIITEWISLAEPPDNAKYGASLRYEKWGQVYGETPTGSITLNAKPDEAAGFASHFNYLWTVKSRLDSVNHCTLGEYIDAKLAQDNTGRCENRYKPIVPELVGKPTDAAKKLLTQRKLNPVLKVGSSAPSKTKAMTVERQDAKAESERDKNSSVTLWVYGPYIPKITVPNVVGLSLNEASDRLKQSGFKSLSVKQGAPARLENLSSKVAFTTPAAGVNAKANTPVVMTIYKLSQTVTMPNLVGTTLKQAQEKMLKIGLASDPRAGKPAQSKIKEGMVQGQFAKPGSQVKRGTRVTFLVYGPYVSMVTMPNVVNLPVQTAIQRLRNVGLKPDVQRGRSAKFNTQEGKIQGQFARPGSKLKKGQSVRLLAFGPAPKITESKPKPNPNPRAQTNLTSSRNTPSSNSSGNRTNACGQRVADKQKYDNWRKLPFHGLTTKGYNFQVHSSIASAQGVKVSNAELYKNGQYLLHLAFYWLDKKTKQGITTYQTGLSRFKSKETKDRKFVIESRDRYAFVLSSPYTLNHAKAYPAGRNISKTQLKSIVCSLLSKVEEQAVSRNAANSNKPKPPTRTQLTSGALRFGKGDCGTGGYSGSQKRLPSAIPFAGISNGILRIRKNRAVRLTSGYPVTSAATSYYGSTSQSEKFHYGLAYSKSTAEKLPRNARTGRDLWGSRVTYIESPNRYAYVYYYQTYKLKYPSADLRGAACKVLSTIEQYAYPKEKPGRFGPTSTTRSDPGTLRPVDCSKQGCLGAPKKRQPIYGVPGL